ncbi:MAG: 16S rRNA (guanine(966)-N(2))-methyltransferase RsmD, partial [Gemmatimonadetes bacterium]|nr:16S rRNA (guanine(966)-N(2))-methyltransferase RsmD [Gemmatimonadota bacterium]
MRIIAGRWRGHTIAAPPGSGTRPTTDRVREAWMSALQLDLPGSRVLDLFAGSGALGLEALSRGAVSATVVGKADG